MLAIVRSEPVRGTTPPEPREVVLEVPEAADLLSFGVTLVGTGALAIDGLRFEPADDEAVER